MKPFFGYSAFFLALILQACGHSSQMESKDTLTEGQRDSLNKIFYDCCYTHENKQWLEKPQSATINANKVLVRWHPFSPKIVRVLKRGEQVKVNAYIDLNQKSFGLLAKDTFYIFQSDTLFLSKGRRLSMAWEDTVAKTAKVSMRRYDLNAPYFGSRTDSTLFYMILNKDDIEVLQETRWYYIETKDSSDACIMGRYLDMQYQDN